MMRRIWILASSILVFSPLATAQHHNGMGGGMVAAGPAVAAAPHAVVTAPHAAGSAPHAGARLSTGVHMATAPVGTHRTQVNGITNATANHHLNVMSGLANLPVFPTDFTNSPGLGFDYPHLAAVNSGRMHRHLDGGASFGFGGFLLSSPGVVVVEGQPGESQQPVPEDNAVANANARDNGPDLDAQFLPVPAPVRDAAEYVFVRRDGSLLFAVAYSWDNGTLRYVTRDGLRRSVAQDTLDMDATQQFNEQRGLNFRVPA